MHGGQATVQCDCGGFAGSDHLCVCLMAMLRGADTVFFVSHTLTNHQDAADGFGFGFGELHPLPLNKKKEKRKTDKNIQKSKNKKEKQGRTRTPQEREVGEGKPNLPPSLPLPPLPFHHHHPKKLVTSSEGGCKY